MQGQPARSPAPVVLSGSSLRSQRAVAVSQPSLSFVVRKPFSAHQLSLGRNCSRCGIHSFSVLFAGGSSHPAPQLAPPLACMAPLGFQGELSPRVLSQGVLASIVSRPSFASALTNHGVYVPGSQQLLGLRQQLHQAASRSAQSRRLLKRKEPLSAAKGSFLFLVMAVFFQCGSYVQHLGLYY